MNKELTTKQETGLAVPDYLKQYQGEGSEDISASLIEKSFLQMAHEDKDGVKFGEWYDSTTGISFGSEVSITVCKMQQNWRKFNSDFQLEASSTDGINWDNGDDLSEDEKWKCAFLDVFVLLNDFEMNLPHIVSFKSTSFKTGKKLATAIAKFTKGNGEPMFARSYTLYTEEAKKGSKPYSVCKYKLNAGFNSEAVVTTAAKVRQMVMDITPVMTETEAEVSESDFSDADID